MSSELRASPPGEVTPGARRRRGLSPGQRRRVLGILGGAVLLQLGLLGATLLSVRSDAQRERVRSERWEPPAAAVLLEPGRGCYLGAFVQAEQSVRGSMRRWERLTGKGHATYLTYVGYGRPFPKEWVQSVRALGAVPTIALEPNDGLDRVTDDAYLREFARSAGKSGGPLFLRFASEMNGAWTAYSGKPREFREKFRLVSRVMRRYAPNAALVWCSFSMPGDQYEAYYPGDDAVDWVGVNIYSVHHHDGDWRQPADHEDPLDFLKPVYARFAARKPIQISEYGVTHYCKACRQPVPQFAVSKLGGIYRSLPRQYPRVKLICYFNFDTIDARVALNNYSVTDRPETLEAYRRLIADDYYLARVPPGSVVREAPGSPVYGWE